jgi:hypothetical protein
MTSKFIQNKVFRIVETLGRVGRRRLQYRISRSKWRNRQGKGLIYRHRQWWSHLHRWVSIILRLSWMGLGKNHNHPWRRWLESRVTEGLRKRMEKIVEAIINLRKRVDIRKCQLYSNRWSICSVKSKKWRISRT